MFIIDFTQPFIILLYLACMICMIFLGHEIKKAFIPALGLIMSIALLIMHTLQLFIFKENYQGYESILSTSMIYDFGFVLVTYISYLWIDNIEAKLRNKKSIDNSLDWFWSKIV